MDLLRFLSRLFVGLVFVLIFIVLGATFLFNSKWFWSKTVVGLVNPFLKEIQIRKFQSDTQSFYFPNQLILQNARLTMARQEEEYAFNCQYVHLEKAAGIFFAKTSMRVHLEDCQAEVEDIRMSDVNLNGWIYFEGNRLDRLTGEIRASTAHWNEYELTNLKATIEMEGNQVQLPRIFAYFYGGQVQGKAMLQNTSLLPYLLQLNLTDIQLRRLRDTQNTIFSQIDGRVLGDIVIKGTGGEIDSIDGNLNIAEGGQVKATWLSFIVPQLPPRSLQRKEIEALIKSDGDFPFEKFLVRTQTIGPEKITSEVRIESKRFSLDIDCKVDTHLEGGLANLLSYFKIF